MRDDLFTRDLFATGTVVEPRMEIAEGAVLLRGFVDDDLALLDGIEKVSAVAPFRHMTTPGGYLMSVAMTNCGKVGWVTDRRGYRYAATDPETGRSWPVFPAAFTKLAARAAAEAGFENFRPDSCLINCYMPGARLTLHQDKNEKDFSAPIVSVSLGLPAVFLFGGTRRNEKTRRLHLEHGDVAVWGGVSRLAFHGVTNLRKGNHPLIGNRRFNLTFRKAL